MGGGLFHSLQDPLKSPELSSSLILDNRGWLFGQKVSLVLKRQQVTQGSFKGSIIIRRG